MKRFFDEKRDYKRGFPAGTFVLAENGYKKIEQIKVGEKVYDIDGNLNTVSDIEYALGPTIKIKDLECAPHQQILTETKKEIALHAEGQRLAQLPKFDIKGYEGSPHFFYILGKWLANGWTFCGKIMIRSRNDDMLNEALNYLDVNFCLTEEQIYKIDDDRLLDFFTDNFGKYETEKHIPIKLIGVSEENKEALLKAIGHTWLNKELALGIDLFSDVYIKKLIKLPFIEDEKYFVCKKEPKSKSAEIEWINKEKILYNLKTNNGYIIEGVLTINS